MGRADGGDIREKEGQVRCSVAECQENGWKAHCESVEVGCRGFGGQSLHRVLGLLGNCRLQRCRAIKNMLEAAEKASQWLFYGLAVARIVLLHFPWLGELAREGDPKATLAFRGKPANPALSCPFQKTAVQRSPK